MHEIDEIELRFAYPPHFDGVINPYWQINTAYSKEASSENGSVAGTHFIIDEYCLGQPPQIDFFNDLTLEGHKPDCYSSTLFLRNQLNTLHPQGQPTKRGMLDKLQKERVPLPDVVCRFEGFVPLGATIVFVNGYDLSSKLNAHNTHSAFRNADGILKDTFLFWRIASLGRVQARDATSTS